MYTPQPTDTWSSSWLDAVAFVIGLAVAWWGGWNAGDLIWSLWLSSFVVGYATIVWMIGRPAAEFAWKAWRERALVGADKRSVIIFCLLILGGAAFLLAFFTVHFGGFHYVHSQFLISFFPVDLPGSGRASHAGMATYVEVARRYWAFLPSAFLAHRGAFLRRPFSQSIQQAVLDTPTGPISPLIWKWRGVTGHSCLQRLSRTAPRFCGSRFHWTVIFPSSHSAAATNLAACSPSRTATSCACTC